MNPTAIAADDHAGRDGVRRPTYLGGYYAVKSPPDIEPLTLRVPQDPLQQATCGPLMIVDHAPFPLGAEAAVMVIVV